MGIRQAFGAAALVLVAVACSTETELTIAAQGQNAEGETVPLSNVALDILPYDIDQLYQEMESRTQPGEPPVADSIRALSQTYQDVCTAYRVTGDSIEAVRQEATSIAGREGETSDAYRAAFERYQVLVAREEQRFARCQEVTDTYTAVRNEYREARRAWEERAWPGAEFASAESLRIGDLPLQRAETNPDGFADVTVPNGTWWILGAAPVPGSISQQYRWNVQVEGEGGQDTVRLTGENATLEPVF
ncbi:MAG TPA: hypothetical protein VM737_10035 [Gemmatimonadota bacterium]|nr:hypothetical protein [Gemmatimonadota bacterium]